MRVLVTGAAGWSGAACVGSLLEAGHSVVAHDLPAAWLTDARRGGDAWAVDVTPAPGQNLKRVSGDLLRAADVRSAMGGCDAVVHVAVLHDDAPIEGGSDEQTALVFRVQIQGLFNVLEAAKEPPTTRVVHVSSCWTSHSKVPFFDGTTRRPDWSLYACSKRLQEELCQQYHDAHGLQVVMLRPDHIVDSRSGQGGAPQGPLKTKTLEGLLQTQRDTG